MTTEEKAKAYDEALKRIKKYYDMGSQPSHSDLECIFPQLRESEDERTRNEIITFIEQAIHSGGGVSVSKEKENKWLAYLEKQKEQKPEQYSPLCNTIKDKIREYIANHFVADTIVKTDIKSIVKAMEEGVRLGREECRPAEWSDKDKTIIEGACNALEIYGHTKLASMLKSLCPYWKPNKEQMEAFRKYIEDFQERAEVAVGGWDNFNAMIFLYEQLKKL